MDIKHVIKIEIPAQAAAPTPPVGPKVGQYGINIMNLCKEFNAATKHIEINAPVPILLTIYKNRTFSFVLKSLPTAYLIKKYAKDNKISKSDALKVVLEKAGSLTSHSEEAGLKTVSGTAKSMGITITED